LRSHIHDDRELTEWLLSKGADVNAGCYYDYTCLSAAMIFAPLDTITILLEKGHGDVHRGQLLHNVISRLGPESEVIQLVKLLLQKGASINDIQYKNHGPSWAVKSPFGMGTPLHYATALNKLDVVSCLLENGADPMITNSRGKTVLDIAGERAGDAMIQILRNHIPC
jgi:ankyrin repeat protein